VPVSGLCFCSRDARVCCPLCWCWGVASPCPCVAFVLPRSLSTTMLRTQTTARSARNNRMYVCKDSAAPQHTRVYYAHTGPRRHARAPACVVADATSLGGVSKTAHRASKSKPCALFVSVSVRAEITLSLSRVSEYIMF